MSLHSCAFKIDDDLHAFADQWTRGGNAIFPSSIIDCGNAKILNLYNDGKFQVELCFVQGGTVIPNHVHPEADTIEIGVMGAVRFFVNNQDPYASIPDDRLPSLIRGRGIRINHNDVHGGYILPCGTAFLSIQRWKSTPKSVVTNYVGNSFSKQHEAML